MGKFIHNGKLVVDVKSNFKFGALRYKKRRSFAFLNQFLRKRAPIMHLVLGRPLLYNLFVYLLTLCNS